MISAQIYAATIVVLSLAFFVVAVRQDNFCENAKYFFDQLEGHKEDIIISVIGLTIVGRSSILPDESWVKIVESGEIFYIILGIGISLGAGKSGDGIRKWLKKRKGSKNTG